MCGRYLIHSSYLTFHSPSSPELWVSATSFKSYRAYASLQIQFFHFLSVVFIHKYHYVILCEKSCPTAEMLRAALIRILEADMCSSTVLLWRQDVKEMSFIMVIGLAVNCTCLLFKHSVCKRHPIRNKVGLK